MVGSPVGAQTAAKPTVHVVLPPGNSQHFSQQAFATVGPREASGQPATPDPDEWGPWVDDQRELYWGYEFRDGVLRPEPVCDDPQSPRAGVTICFDDYGVPAVYADDNEDLWFGVGYAVAQIRLFLVDAIRRTARGTLSELAGGHLNVQDDVATRITAYSDAEYEAMVRASSPEAIENTEGYVAGFNQWVNEVRTTNRDALPAEYTVLAADPQPLTVADVGAIGVLFVRFVAAEGRQEMEHVKALRALEGQHGTERGRDLFLDLVWQEDPLASVTAHSTFPRTEYWDKPDELERVFDQMADYAATLPLELATGDGTGHYVVPGDAQSPDGVVGSIEDLVPPIAGEPRSAANAGDPARMVSDALDGFRRKLHGGSFLVAIAPQNTADGSALLISEPQLLMSPQLLLEIEIHGAGYNGRGSTAPGVPVLGIGYNDDIAWALTTGNSKTIDSFIETVRPDSNADGTPEYLHDGQWKEQQCRDEDISWRETQQGAPVGPAVNTVTIQVCRTLHGPIVAVSDDGTLARSTQYATWMREVETIEGVGFWAKATTLEEFEELTSHVSWNENVAYADKSGNIAWWHPGLHHIRNPETDFRLPIPGTGEFDHGGFLAFDDLPHEVNPAAGYLVNWNNKPAQGWLDGGGQAVTSLPAGAGGRHRMLQDFIASRTDWTIDDLRAIDQHAASTDHRAHSFLPLLLDLRGRSDLTDTNSVALDLLASWDGSANGSGAQFEFDYASTPATVGAAASIFHRAMQALPQVLFADTWTTADFDLMAAQTGMGRHFYDTNAVLNLALRVLEPSSSGLAPRIDHLRGRAAGDVLLEALTTATDALDTELGGDPGLWRTAYGSMEPVCASVGGTIGPCPMMPFLERGSWIHLVGFPNARAASPAPVPAPEPAQLPATGGGLALAGLLAVALAARRRHPG